MVDKKQDVRVRNWATVLYPESAIPNWIEILSSFKIPVLISPLHDKDVNPGGELKKPHFHIIFQFEGKKSLSQVKELTSEIGAVGQERINSLRGYSRYLCHLDNPEKAQYSLEDVRCLCGADINSNIGLPTDKYKAIKEMMNFCRVNSITSFSILMDYSSENHFDWFRILCDNGAIVMKEYLKSLTWTSSHEQSFVDLDTGEVTD